MSDREITERLRRAFWTGRRLQADNDRHRGLWHMSLCVPVFLVTTAIITIPFLSVLMLLLILGLGDDAASYVVLALFTPPGWVLYHIVLGMEEDSFGA